MEFTCCKRIIAKSIWLTKTNVEKADFLAWNDNGILMLMKIAIKLKWYSSVFKKA